MFMRCLAGDLTASGFLAANSMSVAYLKVLVTLTNIHVTVGIIFICIA